MLRYLSLKKRVVSLYLLPFVWLPGDFYLPCFSQLLQLEEYSTNPLEWVRSQQRSWPQQIWPQQFGPQQLSLPILNDNYEGATESIEGLNVGR